MINYAQLGRNLRRFAPKVEPKFATYVFNPKGIYDFKQMNPKMDEALTEAFRDVKYPVLEISAKKSGSTKGSIVLKDGYEEFSSDTFVLKEGENIENFLPETEGCIKKMTYDKKGIDELKEQYHLLDKFLTKLTENLKKPIIELWFKERSRYSIGNVVVKDGDSVVLKGYFSKEKQGNHPIEKYHFISQEDFATGYIYGKDIYGKRYSRLSDDLIKRLWMLDERAKDIVKKYFGIGCSPRSSNQIAKNMSITGARVRGIVAESKEYMQGANTYNTDLNANLDELGEILTDEERYKIYQDNSSFLIWQAKLKIKESQMKQKI